LDICHLGILSRNALDSLPSDPKQLGSPEYLASARDYFFLRLYWVGLFPFGYR